MTVRCVKRLQIAFKDIYYEFYARLETRAQCSIQNIDLPQNRGIRDDFRKAKVSTGEKFTMKKSVVFSDYIPQSTWRFATLFAKNVQIVTR